MNYWYTCQHGRPSETLTRVKGVGHRACARRASISEAQEANEFTGLEISGCLCVVKVCVRVFTCVYIFCIYIGLWLHECRELSKLTELSTQNI